MPLSKKQSLTASFYHRFVKLEGEEMKLQAFSSLYWEMIHKQLMFEMPFATKTDV